MEVSRARALIAVLRRDLPELLAPGIDERAVATDAGARIVLGLLLAALPVDLRASLQRKAGAAELRERLEGEVRLGSKTAPRLLLGLFTEKEGTRH
jgi:hypothetical protein